MRESQIEPGLGSLFRISILVWLFMTAVGVFGSVIGWNPFTFYGLVSVLYSILLIMYLSSRGLQSRMGRWYLPVALLLATLGPILAQISEIAWTLTRGLPLVSLKSLDLGLFLPLLIPAMIIAAQYGYRALLGYVLTATMLQVLLIYTFAPFNPAVVHFESPVMDIAGEDAVVRFIIYPIMGLFVVRLLRGQKEEQQKLSDRNLELTKYASTIERLTLSHERNRLARELHDTLAHTLSAISVQIEALNKELDRDPNRAKQSVQNLRDLVRTGLSESRRALGALRASPLEDLGLALAIQGLVESAAERSGLRIKLDLPEDPIELPPSIEQGIYRIMEEALSNVVRHASANNLRVSLQHVDNEMRLTIDDDGRGFDPESIDLDGHYGLLGMRERAQLCGGQLAIISEPGSGTTVVLRVGGG